MPWVLPEIFRAINHEPFAAEKVDSVRHTLRIDVFTRTLLEILTILETLALLDACLVHFTRFLAQRWVLIMVRLEIL